MDIKTHICPYLLRTILGPDFYVTPVNNCFGFWFCVSAGDLAGLLLRAIGGTKP